MRQNLKKILGRTLLVLAALAVILLVTVWFPIKLDPYNVFHYNCIRFNGVEPNQNFIKTRYIIDNPERFDSFLFGSSRVGMMDVSRIRSGHFYNMAYSEGLPAEHLRNLRLFLKHGVRISNVWIGVDNISCFVDPAKHQGVLMRREYPEDERLWKFYLPYVNCSMAFHSLDTIMAADRSDGEKEEDFYLTGNSWLSQEINRREKANRPAWDKHYKARFSECLQELRQIMQLCQEHGIRLTFFTNPLYENTYEKCLAEGYGEFLKALAKVTPYHDFSGIPMTTNRDCYIESSHYRFKVGDFMIEALENTDAPYLTGGEK